MKEDIMTLNEISHYESLKKQDTANRKLIKKLQLDKKALKEQLTIPVVSICSNCKMNGMQSMNDSPCSMLNECENTCSNYNEC